MKLSRLAVSVYVGFVFLSGTLIGGIAYRLYAVHSVSANTRTREEIRHAYVNEMHTRLKLNQDQVKQLTIILDDIANRFDQLHNKMRAQVWEEMRLDRQRIHAGQVEEINGILNPDQQAEYQKMREERQRRRKEKVQGGSLKCPPGVSHEVAGLSSQFAPALFPKIYRPNGTAEKQKSPYSQTEHIEDRDASR